MGDELLGLSPFNKKVVDKFRAIPGVQSIWLDSPGDESGRRGQRYTIICPLAPDTSRPGTEQQLRDVADSLREENPEFAWNFLDVLDDWPRVALWKQATGGMVEPIRKGEMIAVRDIVWRAMNSLPEVVEVTCSPADMIAHGQRAFVTVVVRVDPGAAPLSLLREIDRRATELRKAIPEIVEMQAAPELNFVPSGADDENDPWLELKGEIMRAVEPHKLIVAVWFAAIDGKYPKAWIYGEDESVAQRLQRENALGVDVVIVSITNPVDVPREAKCIFNSITRMVKAQAEGNAAEYEYYKDQLRAKVIAAPERRFGEDQAPFTPAPRISNIRDEPDKTINTRGDASTHFVPCRWCGFSIPASSNPAYQDRCPNCGAIQPATQIPTKQKEMPYISIFVNPDNSAYFEFVFAPPQPGRLDLCKVLRCTLPGEFFTQHPMGRSPKVLATKGKK